MAQLATPMLRRWELGSALRRLREERQMTIADVTVAMKERFGSSFSTTKLSRMETAKRGVIPRDVHDLCTLYGVPEKEREHLMELAKSAREPDEWHADTDPRGYRRYVALEQLAVASHEYTMTYIPGLLQTAGYAQAVEDLIYLATDYYVAMVDIPERADDRVDLRIQRQQLLSTDTPLHLHVIIDENALRRRLPQAGVMAGQLRHLLNESARPNIRIQIMPLDVGLYPGSESSYWTVLEFPEGEQFPPRTGYVEGVSGARLIEREADVTRMASGFEVLTRMALNSAESRVLIERVLSEYSD
jgi:transcriptional regulator with XRE-family HTH domain